MCAVRAGLTVTVAVVRRGHGRERDDSSVRGSSGLDVTNQTGRLGKRWVVQVLGWVNRVCCLIGWVDKVKNLDKNVILQRIQHSVKVVYQSINQSINQSKQYISHITE